MTKKEKDPHAVALGRKGGKARLQKMTPEQRRKDRCRSYANVYLKRGKLKREPCLHCGTKASQMHHPDYDQPLLVQWLCRPCNLVLHRTASTVERRTSETRKGSKGPRRGDL